MTNVNKVIKKSAHDFQNIVWPVFKEKLGGGYIISTEEIMDSDICNLFDWEAGVDAWQIINGYGIRAIASRVQWGSNNWKSWTIRKQLRSGRRTEYDKLINQDITLLKPAYHIQAYISEYNGNLLGAACINTNDLICLLKNGLCGKEKPNPQDGNLFVPVWWNTAIKQQCDMIVYEEKR